MFYRGILYLTSIIALLFASFIYFDKNQVNYTCSSENSLNMRLSERDYVSRINMLASVTRSQMIFAHFDGSVYYNNIKYHLNREVGYHYRIVDAKNGLIRITTKYQHRNESDTVQAKDFDSLFLGIVENGSSLIRTWRVGDRILLIGNPYSPMYSCVLLGE